MLRRRGLVIGVISIAVIGCFVPDIVQFRRYTYVDRPRVVHQYEALLKQRFYAGESAHDVKSTLDGIHLTWTQMDIGQPASPKVEVIAYVASPLRADETVDLCFTFESSRLTGSWVFYEDNTFFP